MDAGEAPPPITSGDVAGLFARYSHQLHRYCASRVGHSAAEDIVADTFLIAYERREAFAGDRGTAQSWLFGIATNLLRRRRRDEVRGFRAMARTGLDPLTESEQDERAISRADASVAVRRLAAALAGLPQRQRDVLFLFVIGELEYAEIAAALDIPLGSVQSALHRARTKVRLALEATQETGHV